MPCHIIGNAVSANGAIRPRAVISFRRANPQVIAIGEDAVIPDTITIVTESDGGVDFYLMPGLYVGSVVAIGNIVSEFGFSVPNDTDADFADCLEAGYVDIPPASVLAAQQARDDARDARDAAIEASDDARDAANDAAVSAQEIQDILDTSIPLNPILVQEKVNELFMGVDGTQIFPNAQTTAQGIAFCKLGSQRKVFLLQRVAGTGSWTADERMRIVEYNMTDDGSVINHVSFSPELSMGHQMISARVEGSQIYIYGSTPVAGGFTGDNRGKGVVKFPWKGAATSQSDFVHYQLCGMAGSGHRFQGYKLAHTFVDDDYIMLLTSDTSNDPDIDGDIETGDSKVVIWNRAEVEAAADPLEVDPVAAWPRIKPRQIQNNYTQGACIARGHVWVQCGYFPPLLQHMIQVWTLDGRLVTEFGMDGARGDYDFDQLRGVGPLGIPTSLEPEGLTVDDNGNVISLSMDIWRTPTSVVSRGSQAYAAFRSSMPVGTPCTNVFWWTPVNLTPSAPWDKDTAYTIGSYTRRTKVLHRIKAPEGGAREKPINSGRTLVDSTAFLAMPNAAADITWPQGETLGFMTFNMNANEYREQVAFRGGNAIRVRDTNEDADLTRYFQIKHISVQGGDYRNLTEIRADQGAIAYGSAINMYGHDDPFNPYTITIFSGAPEGDASGSLRVRRTEVTVNVPVIAPGLPRIIDATGERVAVTGTTDETTLATITIPAGVMGPKGFLRIHTQTGQTNNSNNKTFRIKCGGQNIVSSTAAYTGSSATGRLTIWQNRNSNTSQVVQGSAAENGIGETTQPVTVTTVNTAASFDVVITGQLANSGDELALESYIVEVVNVA